MQWNTNELENWEELRQFVDTALLPLYLYRSHFSVQEHVLRMNYLLNVAAGIEQKLKGRVLLFPMNYHFTDEPLVQKVPEEFTHAVLLHFSSDSFRPADSHADVLLLSVGEEELDSALRFEVTVDVLYKEVIRYWQKNRAQ
ncbi:MULTISPECIES: DUF2487 family protein [Brevibacillus]|uniref:DUF2487 family protein n=1 Tax=Brevibacillus invocatus TaxID=173959 RepID=A0A3M8CIA8_9BACL|nr:MULTISPECIES: DUF2487 family protein [Brevibacillus]MCM3077874.1 YpiF family protein [Brevibacillus invocatus]MCM3428052.1 YpiF family protein [Brevibacillus invocatus]MDH4616037.1 DUF2487 family protein [Brevibacillus sp. AY1]RNB75328.1 DUF2487 family protein [Brevibacillus invocatus]